MKLTTITKLAAALVITFAVAIPSAAFACGPYGPITDEQRVRWAMWEVGSKNRNKDLVQRRRVVKTKIEGDNATAIVLLGQSKRIKKWDPNQLVRVRMVRVELNKKDGRWKVSKQHRVAYPWITTVDKFYKMKLGSKIARL